MVGGTFVRNWVQSFDEKMFSLLWGKAWLFSVIQYTNFFKISLFFLTVHGIFIRAGMILRPPAYNQTGPGVYGHEAFRGKRDRPFQQTWAIVSTNVIGSAHASDRSTNVSDHFNQRVTLATFVQHVKGSDQLETRGIRKVANDRYWSRTTVIDVLFSFYLAAILE